MCDFSYDYVYNLRDFIADYLIIYEEFEEDLAEAFADRYCDLICNSSDLDLAPDFIKRAYDAFDKFMRYCDPQKDIVSHYNPKNDFDFDVR